jgi:hypothetical protein
LQTASRILQYVGKVLPVHVTLSGEEGVDAGGLTSTLYRLFFRDMLLPACGLFECRPRSAVYLPKKGASLNQLTVVGYMIARCIIDERVAEVPLALSVWRHLLELPPKLHDLESVDSELYRQLQLLLSMPDVTPLCLDFQGLKRNGEREDVTEANKHEYVRLKVRDVLLESIRPELDALSTGFNSVEALTPHLHLLSPLEIRCLLCGDEFLNSQMILQEIEFAGFPPTSRTPVRFRLVLETLDSQSLRKFLLFVTEQSSVPVGGFPRLDGVAGTRKIRIVRYGHPDSLPQSHTCFLTLDLPDYEDFELIKEKLLIAIEETSYQIA